MHADERIAISAFLIIFPRKSIARSATGPRRTSLTFWPIFSMINDFSNLFGTFERWHLNTSSATVKHMEDIGFQRVWSAYDAAHVHELTGAYNIFNALM